MSLTVTRAGVKAKAALDTTEFDSRIDDLIAEWVPVVEYALDPWALNDSTPGLVKTLDVGATEWIAGEFLAQMGRMFGLYDGVKVGDFEVRPFFRPNPLDPSGLKDQARRRLRPYFKPEAASAFSTKVLSADGKADGDDP